MGQCFKLTPPRSKVYILLNSYMHRLTHLQSFVRDSYFTTSRFSSGHDEGQRREEEEAEQQTGSHPDPQHGRLKQKK